MKHLLQIFLSAGITLCNFLKHHRANFELKAEITISLGCDQLIIYMVNVTETFIDLLKHSFLQRNVVKFCATSFASGNEVTLCDGDGDCDGSKVTKGLNSLWLTYFLKTNRQTKTQTIGGSKGGQGLQILSFSCSLWQKNCKL